MINTCAIVAALRKAGFAEGRIHTPEGSDLSHIRIPGVTASEADIKRLLTVLPAVEACGVRVQRMDAGDVSPFDDFNGGTMIVSRSDQDICIPA